MNPRYSVKPFIWSSHQMIAEIIQDSLVETILDVGCDRGFLGQILNTNQKLYGIDKKNLGKLSGYVTTWQADIEESNFRFLVNHTFDLIILADILEHLKDPKEVLEKLKPYLKKDGLLIISVPNMDFILVRILKLFNIRPKMKKGLFDSDHRHDFNEQSIISLAKKTGFEVEKINFTPVPLPILSSLFNSGKPLNRLYSICYMLTQKFPALFAYQIIIQVSIMN